MEHRILLVEDDADSAEAIILLLHTHGIDAEWAATAAEAIARFEEGRRAHYDAIMLDLRLPDMDGVELVHRLSGIVALPPVIIHSAATRQIACRAGEILRAVAVLGKPAEWRSMRAALEQCGAFPEVPSS